MRRGQIAISFLLPLISVLPGYVYGQGDELSGDFCVDLYGEHYRCLTFHGDGRFEYREGASLGDSYHGRGVFYLRDSILILDHNGSPPKLSSHALCSYWVNSKDSVTLNFEILDMDRGTIGGANIFVPQTGEGILADPDGKASWQLQKSRGDPQLVVSYIGYDPCQFYINKEYNYHIKVFLGRSGTGVPIRDQIDTMKISERGRDHFKVKLENGKMVLWKRSD